MSLRIYVAGASRELDRVRSVQRALRLAGHAITFDWTEGFEAQRELFPSDADVPEGARIDLEQRCAAGVFCAEVFWLLAPRTASIGCWVELRDACWIESAREGLSGAPFAVIASGAKRHRDATIFSSRIRPEHCFDDDDAALQHVLRIAPALIARRAS